MKYRHRTAVETMVVRRIEARAYKIKTHVLPADHRHSEEHAALVLLWL